MIEYTVYHISNGTWLTSGTEEECRKYCKHWSYVFVKAEGQNGEHWYVE